MTGMRISMRTTSGRIARTTAIASRPSPPPHDLQIGLGIDEHPDAGTEERLVVDEDDAHQCSLGRHAAPP